MCKIFVKETARMVPDCVTLPTIRGIRKWPDKGTYIASRLAERYAQSHGRDRSTATSGNLPGEP
jgi:hypothetical protein